jgi:hypothetical protein
MRLDWFVDIDEDICNFHFIDFQIPPVLQSFRAARCCLACSSSTDNPSSRVFELPTPASEEGCIFYWFSVPTTPKLALELSAG